ncbi:sigma 54 modulation/S30EA ribosomal C-terminal domain-containing protein [Rugosimonospora africana]|uniref:Sigma 54 modulation/S30EA ribosomal protein C-terminal domain-containing protein n=1 Tax=Rugosimonospora africana TaxID=556532 RepID=A0A8J3R386_9ACTN|nr:sigma 54 modulation/S30EA ribosomal C-terminal domain-containing protein [Rugosimonospora africana]GIH21466.1 hypothetical protein Raf01_96380 [Rugosimonospora africana]
MAEAANSERRPSLLFGSHLLQGVRIQVRGDLDPDAYGFADTAVALLARAAHRPVRSARVRLTHLPGPTAGRVVAQAVLSLAGRLLRAQTSATLAGHAAYTLSERLADQIARAGQGWPPRPWPPPATASEPVELPQRSCLIVRRKTHPLACCPPRDAATHMDAMDYNIHLFIDADTGQDAAIYRVGPTGYRLARQHTLAPPADLGNLPLTLSARRTPHACRPTRPSRY